MALAHRQPTRNTGASTRTASRGPISADTSAVCRSPSSNRTVALILASAAALSVGGPAATIAIPTAKAFTLPAAISSHRSVAAASFGPRPVPALFTPVHPPVLRAAQNDDGNTVTDTATEAASPNRDREFDGLLERTDLRQATRYMRSHHDLQLTRERWDAIFDAIEETTELADENAINVRREQEVPMLSKTRMDMTDMYTALKEQNHLRLFGAVEYPFWPAAGSHTVDPALLERVSGLSMQALTPKKSNTLLFAGAGLAVLEGLVSVAYGLNLNVMVLLTVMLAIFDNALLNGAVQETVVKTLSPKTQQKITRHEAGHFLCAYILGCPVEGYVLSAWAALQDNRFGSRGVSAGTSFFDPSLSDQIMSNQIKRSAIDRYSIIVMAGIAAEAVHYGQADGGAGDEMALIQFLLQMNGGPPSPASPWNDITIRNQARWGALQAALILKEYKECYEALVDALERGGSLGDCIYAIEKAGRDHGKLPLSKPIGQIIESSTGCEWTTTLPDVDSENGPVQPGLSTKAAASAPNKEFDPEETLEALAEYRRKTEERLKNINKELQRLD